MNFKRISVVWTFIVTFTFGLRPPQNVNIIIKGENVTFAWSLPSESILYTLVSVFKGTSTSNVFEKYVGGSETSYTTTVLSRCQQYTVRLRSGNDPLSYVETMETFWTTDKVFTAEINTDVNLTWTNGLDNFYEVNAPYVTIYSVLGGCITQNSDKNHYKIHSVEQNIHIVVTNVTQNDGGLYQSESLETEEMKGCCLLIVTDKPTKPQLTYDKHPFVGFPTVFTCNSEVQRWPSDPYSSISYTFPAIGQQQNNSLAINVTKSDKGKRIYCTTTDDLEKTSESSDVITVDPYYGPEHVSISPPDTVVNVTEGSNFPPVTCSADCNPDCKYVWRNSSNKFTDGNILKIDKVGRIHNGTYLCRVRHPNDTIRGVYEDGKNRGAGINININVLCSNINDLPSEPITTLRRRRKQISVVVKPKNIIQERRTIVTHIGVLENVTIYVVANPEPIVEWITDTGFSWEREQTGTRFKYKLMSHVRIQDESQFGQYGVRIYNSGGSTTVYITIQEGEPVSIVAIIAGLVGGLLVLIIVVLGIIYYKCRISNNVSVQEDRTEPLARTDMPADSENNDHSELNVAANTRNRASGNDEEHDYMEIIDDPCVTGRESETNKDVYMEITDAVYVNAIKSDNSNEEVGETDFYENQGENE